MSDRTYADTRADTVSAKDTVPRVLFHCVGRPSVLCALGRSEGFPSPSSYAERRNQSVCRVLVHIAVGHQNALSERVVITVERMSQSFADEQASNAMLRRRMLEEKQKAESARASEYLMQFVESAKEQGLPTEPLIVRGYGGKGTAKTPLVGWYLKNDRSMAVDVDGNFYLLIEQLSFKDRLTGVTPKPSAPPLILGAGGRDGESIDLTAKLTELLPKWRRSADS